MTFRRRGRLWLLLAAFVCGQLFLLAHAAEHDAVHEADEAAHVCLVCLAGHGLGSAASPAAAPLSLAAFTPETPHLRQGALTPIAAAAPFPARGPPHS
jgi:hypothetical protein